MSTKKLDTDQESTLSSKLARLSVLEQFFQQPDLNLDEALEKHREAVVLGGEVLQYLEHAESELKKVQLPGTER
jgi:exonuclease VII small subunit